MIQRGSLPDGPGDGSAEVTTRLWSPFMRKSLCVGLAVITLLGCDSSTEPEHPKLKTGANAELAIEL